jgi:histidinol-phosphate/aromatic aminotransferase/cobyric acid decarboxylase-like protein
VLDRHRWYEIDDAQDKDIAETIFAEGAEDKLKLIHRRYGGYWRFPRMLDFCYLVNPYFPPEPMKNEMRAYFDELLTGYPSGLRVENLLMGKLFNLDESLVLTGNGAAELIRAAAPLVKGRVGIVYPSFNEYAESFAPHGTVVPLYPRDLAYGLEDLRGWARQCDTLLLINPDNPSGNYVLPRDLLPLLEELRGAGKRLILDESFIDFCDDEFEGAGLFNQETLEQFPNLALIKSLSKSYGIPGIRLGVLASGDPGVIEKVRKNLPIWNINSFAEYFLQIIGKYLKDYRRACRLIAAERRRFRGELEKTGLLQVYPSQANYLLCRLEGGRSALELAKYLLESRDIFIKDLGGKTGLSGDSWVRLAVRNQQDNDILLEGLRGWTS